MWCRQWPDTTIPKVDLLITFISFSTFRDLCYINQRNLLPKIPKTTTRTRVIRQPASPAGSVVTLHGRFEILSLSGTALLSPGAGGLSIFFVWWARAGGWRESSGAFVSIWASDYLMAASFANAGFERLPLVGEEEEGGVQVQPSASQSSGVTGGGGQRGEGGESASAGGSYISSDSYGMNFDI